MTHAQSSAYIHEFSPDHANNHRESSSREQDTHKTTVSNKEILVTISISDGRIPPR